MSIVFNADDHSYVSVDPNDQIKWTSVTTLVSSLKKPFDAKKVAERVTKSKRSKWYGIEPKIIVQIWDNEANRATTLGTFYHNQRESDLCSFASIEREGVTVPVFKPYEEPNGLKIKRVETKEQLRTGEVTPDQTKPLLDKSMLVVNQKLPLDSKTLATMASKLSGIEKSLVGPQFETALAGVWGEDLINKFNSTISTLGYQLGQAGPYKTLMGDRSISNINSIAAVSAMVNDLKLLRDGLTYLAQVKAGMKVMPSEIIKQALPYLKNFSQKNQLGLA